MLKERRERQQEMDLVILEQLIPEEHLLRKVEKAVDFSFIYPLCAPLYSENNGRSAIDPEMIFRMLKPRYPLCIAGFVKALPPSFAGRYLFLQQNWR